ncbi:MAG TPA: hypothetical protein VMF08_03670 [Candidatus Sulfotelmatobacter sp.]|nr:hypothetical protein [Candidatus Sulfotelmatobacter sp.]
MPTGEISMPTHTGTPEDEVAISVAGQLSMESGDLSIPIYGSPVMVVHMPPKADIHGKRAIVTSIDGGREFKAGESK